LILLVGFFKRTHQRSVRTFRLPVQGKRIEITLGNGTDYGICEVYVDDHYWGSRDLYHASATEETFTIDCYEDTDHVLDIRVRREKNRAASGYKLALKQVEVSREYEIQTILYGYDALARLQTADYFAGLDVTATPTRSYAYNYDRASNRTRRQVWLNGVADSDVSYTYNGANQLTSDGVNSYTYDANGNLISNGTDTYTWDRANRLLTFGGSSYEYNGLGQRVKQTVNSIATQYLLDVQPGLYKVLATTTGSNTDRYIHDPMGIAQHEDNLGNWHFLTKDGLGTVRHVYDDSLSEVYAVERDPYGELITNSGSNPTPFEYTGEPLDQNDLLHLRARYYEPSLGTFVSLDPLETANRYGYVDGNPINFVDTTGTMAELPSRWDSCTPRMSPSLLRFQQPNKTRCDSLIENLEVRIGEQLYANNYTWEQTQRIPPDASRNMLLEALKAPPFNGPQYFSNTIPNPASFNTVAENFGAQGATGCEKDPANCENTSTSILFDRGSTEGGAIREGYGFKREYFHNSHHFITFLTLALATSPDIARNVNDFREEGTICHQRRKYCRSLFSEQEWNSLMSLVSSSDHRFHIDVPGNEADGSLKSLVGISSSEYQWWLNEYAYDVFITEQAIELAKQVISPTGTRDVRDVPTAVRNFMCSNYESGIWANSDLILQGFAASARYQVDNLSKSDCRTLLLIEPHCPNYDY
jgi:RHS repeat-associated protein